MNRCKSCGAIDSRACNGDNEICTTCGSIDDFEYTDDQLKGSYPSYREQNFQPQMKNRYGESK